MNKWMTLLALILGIAGLVLSAQSPGLGCFTLMLGAVVFMTGNRVARQRSKDKQHKELLDALKKE